MVDNPKLKAFGQQVKALRVAKDLTQEQLAALSDLSPTYIGYIENGHRNPSLLVIYALARGLGINPPELLSNAAPG